MPPVISDPVDDPHAILGVRKNASQKTIKRAYRRLAMLHHPDRNVGDEEAAERFQRIHAAYAALIGKQTEPDNAGAEAHGLLAGLFGAVLNEMIEKGIAPKTRDVVMAMRESLAVALTKLRGEITKLEKARAALEETRGRFSGNEDAVESLEAIAEFHVREVEKQLVRPRKTLGVMEAAAKMLRDCSFRVDPQAMTTATSTSGIFTAPHGRFTVRMGGL